MADLMKTVVIMNADVTVESHVVFQGVVDGSTSRGRLARVSRTLLPTVG